MEKKMETTLFKKIYRRFYRDLGLHSPVTDSKYGLQRFSVAIMTEPKSEFEAGPYLEGQGDLVNGLIIGITLVAMWVMGVINLFSKSP